MVQRHLIQHEPADLRQALRSDAASTKDTGPFHTLRSVFKDFLDLDSPSRQDGLHDESSWLELIPPWMSPMEEKDLNPHPQIDRQHVPRLWSRPTVGYESLIFDVANSSCFDRLTLEDELTPGCSQIHNTSSNFSKLFFW